MKLALLLAAYNIKAQDIGIPTSTGTVNDALANGLKLLMSLVGMLAIVFLIYGGLQMVISRGNAPAVQKARETMTNAVIGIVLAILGFAIVTIIAGLGNK